MKIQKFGLGKSLFNIIVGVHGDEKSPVDGFSLLEEYLQDKEIKKSFSLIIANEDALVAGKRFIEKDLNRNFPGNENGSLEARLAIRLYTEIMGAEFNFDFHSTYIKLKKPYGIVSIYSEKLRKVMAITGVENYIFDNSESLIKFAPNSFAIEVGYELDPNSSISAFEIMKNILVYFEVIDGAEKLKSHETAIYLIYHFVLKNMFLSLSSKLGDFKRIEKGDMIGVLKNNETMTASEGFYAILVNDELSFRKAKRISIEE